MSSLYRNKVSSDELLPNVYFFLWLPSHPKVLGLYCIILIISCFTTIWQTYIILEQFDINFTFQYCAFYFMELYMTNCLILCLISSKIYIPLIKSFKTHFLWDLTIASDKLQRKILRECKYFEILYFFVLFFAACILWVNVYRWACDVSKYYMISKVLIEDFPDVSSSFVSQIAEVSPVTLAAVPAFSPYFHWVVIPLASLTFIMMVTPIWYTFYMFNYLKIQILMLIEKIVCTKQQLDLKNTLDVIYDEEFQRNMTKCLTFFIQRHQEIIKANHILLVKGKNLNFLFLFGTILVSLYSIFTIYSTLFNRFVAIISVIGFSLATLVVGGIGQHFENLSEDLAEAVYNLQWELCNHHNMKLFLILHQYTSCRIIKLPFPSYMSCNVDLIKSFAKFMWSIANFFHTMSQ